MQNAYTACVATPCLARSVFRARPRPASRPALRHRPARPKWRPKAPQTDQNRSDRPLARLRSDQNRPTRPKRRPKAPQTGSVTGLAPSCAHGLGLLLGLRLRQRDLELVVGSKIIVPTTPLFAGKKQPRPATQTEAEVGVATSVGFVDGSQTHHADASKPAGSSPKYVS